MRILQFLTTLVELQDDSYHRKGIRRASIRGSCHADKFECSSLVVLSPHFDHEGDGHEGAEVLEREGEVSFSRKLRVQCQFSFFDLSTHSSFFMALSSRISKLAVIIHGGFNDSFGFLLLPDRAPQFTNCLRRE
jgi:hypothetical protein